MQPGDPTVDALDESEETYCYGHPKTPTKLRCSRCERPICGRCAIPASVGQHCPECVAEARRSAPRVRSAATVNTPVVIGIIALTVIAYIVQATGSFELQRRLASCAPAVYDGQWYRLISPVLAHAGIIHIGFNMLVLYMYGSNVEEAFGSLRVLAIYVASGIMGSAFSLAFGTGAPSIGASGAVFGVVGALLVYLYKRRTSQFVRQHLSSITSFLVLNTVLGFVLPNVDVLAHLGGFVGGVALGYVFDRQPTARPRVSIPVSLLATAAVIALSFALVYGIQQPLDVPPGLNEAAFTRFVCGG